MPEISARISCLLLLCLSFSATGEYTDTLLYNGTIYQHPQANALAIKDGKILAIGSEQQLEPLTSTATQWQDLQGGFLLPGFIDNHNHVFEAASNIGGGCEVSPDLSLEQQAPMLRACQGLTDSQWLIGYGFSLEALQSEPSSLTPAKFLDQFFPEQAVVLMEQTSHAMWVNSKALELAGINAASRNPQGGYIQRDSQGQPSGILLDNAGDRVMELAWNDQQDNFETSYQGLLEGLYQASSHGITTIGDGRLYWQRGWLEVWRAVEQAGELTARVSLRPWIYPAQAMPAQLEFLEQAYSRDLTERLIIDQVKMYSDGIIGNGTARLVSPYRHPPLAEYPLGLHYIAPKAMDKWLTALDKIGYGAHIHAIGDGAVRASLDAIAKRRQQGSNKSFSLTHLEMVQLSDIGRFAKLDITADIQVPEYLVWDEHDWAEPLIGKRRAKAMVPLRPFYQAGTNITLSSDWNVNPINPLVGISNSLRMGARGLPNIDTAIAAYTSNAAKSLGLESITGRLTAGLSADLVVLGKDITRLAPNEIADTEIWLTFLQGQPVFDIDQ